MLAATDYGKEPEPSTSSFVQLSQQCRHFQLFDILLATKNFDESLVIGKGGFGKVYRGTIFNGSATVLAAIKRLDPSSNQGAPEFWAEVEMLSKLRHCNLVSLFGYCNDEEEMILIYEYMPNGTLEDHLHKLGTPLSWVQRLNICIVAGRGLHYLHTGTGIDFGVIHRDVKTSNILLEESWAAKISDFGLSKIGPTNQPMTYVNTLVKGTFGYFDPDYYATGNLTRKSDVYAFGVVLLEVLCRKRAIFNINGEAFNLANWAQESIKKGSLKNIIDFDIRGQVSPKCSKKFVRIAERCLHSSPKKRSTMAEVLSSLESILSLQEKFNNSMQPAGRTILHRMVNMLPFPSNGENTAERMDIGMSESLRYSFGLVKAATNDFSKDNILGQGGFGTVYKGKLKDGQVIAVKRLERNSGQGDLEFKNEVLLVAKLQNHNLVRLLGFSIKGSDRLLIYEFLPNASLDQFIFDPTKRTLLDWGKRYNIIKGIAKGLLYLHVDSRLRIIHRDMKPSNVLLDAEMNPKIADFGLARMLKPEETQGETDRIVGTYGYMAPEYAMHGQFSEKSDVFSFGVLVFEMVTSQKNQSFRSEDGIEDLLSFAWKTWRNGTTLNMIDPILKTGSGSLQDIIRSIHIGLLCVQEKVNDRPTMASVVLMLNSFSVTLPVPSEPAFFIECSSSTSGSGLEKHRPLKSRSRSSQHSKNDVSISEIVPRCWINRSFTVSHMHGMSLVLISLLCFTLYVMNWY